ncbi:cytochrome c oxidase subunit VIa-domain-containing protein [Peziza echinospora]|nr:cytochrome c oxidase subunit VIa-domain-containing protein [Peziza echinospora]
MTSVWFSLRLPLPSPPPPPLPFPSLPFPLSTPSPSPNPQPPTQPNTQTMSSLLRRHLSAQILRFTRTKTTAASHSHQKHLNPQDNPFNRERAELKRHAAETAELWRKISIYVAAPTILVAALNAYKIYTEHAAHEATPLEERKEYAYMNIRAKKFPWKDGDKTLFWNDKVNYHHRDA